MKVTYFLIFLAINLFAFYMFKALTTENGDSKSDKVNEILLNEIRDCREENGKLRTVLTPLNGWVVDCWTCSKLKKQDSTVSNLILEIGTGN